MKSLEIGRMIQWFRAHGVSDKDILDCIMYVAEGSDDLDEDEE